MMISPRKLIKMARKWQKVAAVQRKRISFDEQRGEKGHFIVYTTDERRFSFPIAYLNTWIFRELFRMSEEEFGLPTNGPITLPCDSQFMGYVESLMQNKADRDVEKALVLSMASGKCSSSYFNVHQLEAKSIPALCGC